MSASGGLLDVLGQVWLDGLGSGVDAMRVCLPMEWSVRSMRLKHAAWRVAEALGLACTLPRRRRRHTAAAPERPPAQLVGL